MSEDKLKSCPFCGGEAVERITDMGKGYQISIVKCTKCPAQIAVSALNARDLWNIRKEIRNG